MTHDSRTRIVVVDDDDDLRSLAEMALERDGRFVVVGVGSTGIDAVDLVADGAADVVLLDLEMPWMHGAEAVPLIRRASPSTQIVVWTVDPDGVRAARAREMGASRILAKAYFSPSTLPDELCETLGCGARARPQPSASSSFVSVGRWA